MYQLNLMLSTVFIKFHLKAVDHAMFEVTLLIDLLTDMLR
jgi:hypothetical protein